MALNIKRIPSSIISDLSERGWDNDQISKMTAMKAFDEYCHWHGLIGFGPRLYNLVHLLDKAALRPIEEAPRADDETAQ